jgi:hypothetical protein
MQHFLVAAFAHDFNNLVMGLGLALSLSKFASPDC